MYFFICIRKRTGIYGSRAAYGVVLVKTKGGKEGDLKISYDGSVAVKMATPDPMVTVGVMCQGFPVEMIVRGYLCGSAWRAIWFSICPL